MERASKRYNSSAPCWGRKPWFYSVYCCGVTVGPTGILLASLDCFASQVKH